MTRLSNNQQKKKENLLNCEIYFPSRSQSKIERKQKEGEVPGPC